MYATEPLLGETGSPGSIWHRHRLTLKGHAVYRHPDGLYYRGNKDHKGSRYATIQWSLTLVAVR